VVIVDSPSPGLILVLALVADAVIGEPFGRAHPVALLGGLIGVLERRLNRARRSPSTLRVRGALLLALTVAVAVLAGRAVGLLAGAVPFGWAIEALFVAVLLAGRGLFDHVRRVARALRAGGLEAGRAAAAHIVGRDVTTLDRHGVARAAIESAAENFADGVVAPAFWYLVFGPAGIAAYKAINTLDSMVGYRDERFRDFGFAAARVDDLANWIPARLAAIILCVAALFVPSASPTRAARTVLADARRHASPNAGWPEAAMAGALDLALNGPRVYGGVAGEQPWIGAGRARAEPGDIDRALFMLAVAVALVAVSVAALALIG
jgi:adenosylcobinamide-phosphate synthase